MSLWKRICHPWPDALEIVGEEACEVPSGVMLSSDLITQLGSAMLLRSVAMTLPGLAIKVPLVSRAFILAQLLVEDDPLAVTRVADLLRCLEIGSDVDLEDVRSLLKAVRAPERFETLQAIAYVV